MHDYASYIYLSIILVILNLFTVCVCFVTITTSITARKMEAKPGRTFSKEADEQRLVQARNDKSSVMNSRFESEAKIDEAKVKRQAEWDKVRTPQDPKG